MHARGVGLVLLWVLAITVVAFVGAWLGMTVAIQLALEPVRAVDHILTSIGA